MLGKRWNNRVAGAMLRRVGFHVCLFPFSLHSPSFTQELVTNTDDAFVTQAIRLITNHTHYTSFSSRILSLPLDALLFSSGPAAQYPLVFDYLLRNHNEIKKAKAGMLDLRHLG